MLTKFVGALFFLWLLQAACAQRSAIAYIQATSNGNSGISGSITFTETSAGNVAVAVDISGINTAEASLGIHVHTYGDQTDMSGAAFGPHWVGAGSSTHGCPPTAVRHEGDLGSWTVTNGRISQTKVLDLLTLSGSTSIVGRGVILHDIADPCDSSSTGARIGYGVIGYTQAATNNAAQGENVSKLVCRLQGTDNCPNCAGEVYFQEVGSSVRVTAQVRGLSAGTVHGIHVHQYGDVTDRDAGTSLGGHWNPDGNSHNLPPASNRHRGDLGNIQNYDGNVAWYRMDSSVLGSLSTIAGRGVVVHQTNDHGDGNGCDQAGSSGSRYAICTIGIADAALTIPTPTISINNDFNSQDCTAVVDDNESSPSTTLALTMALAAVAFLLF